MTYLSAALIGLLFVELLFRLPVFHTVKSLAAVTRKSLAVISSRKISDHWKEKVLLSYAGQTARFTITLFLFFVVIFAAVYLSSLTLDFLLHPDLPVLEFLLTAPGILFTTAVSLLYARFLRRHG
jgi:hypothetical protein